MNDLNTTWTSALTMTLLHSLWQGLAIILLTAMVSKWFAVRSAAARYIVKTVAFFVMLATSVVTFLWLLPASSESGGGDMTMLMLVPAADSSGALSGKGVFGYLSTAVYFMRQHQGWIVSGWGLGVLLFSVRFTAAISYLRYLRKRATQANEGWSNTISRLSVQLKMNKMVQLCESAVIHTPVVIGYLKPVVLMPAGLLSGLTTSQVEVILVHELAHIRRHDYLINVIQSLGETLFFFNPSVWILSSWIRNERENCCDDTVLSEGYDPKLYASTLYELENSRLENSKLALALTGNKNQLLNRIKRIMEHSAKNQSGREKFIPVLLLVLGLVFASWISISPRGDESSSPAPVKVIAAADTAKKPIVGSYSRKSVTTYDEKGEPHEEIIESFEGDMIPPDFSPMSMLEFNSLPMLELNFPQPTAPFPSEFMMPPGVMRFGLDTLPGWQKWGDDERMKEFQEKFQMEFKEKFGDFYAKNQKEMEKMMKEVQAQMSRMDQEWIEEMNVDVDEQLAIANREMEQAMSRAHIAEETRKMDEEIRERVDRDVQPRAEEEARLAERAREMADDARMMSARVADEARAIAEVNRKVEEELIKDGYLAKGERMQTLNLKGGNKIDVNGREIKLSEAHRAKYEDLFHQFERRTMPRPKRYHPE